MRRRFFSVFAVAAILVLLVGSVASAATVVSNVTDPDEVVVTEEPAPLALAFATPLTGSAYVGTAFPVDLQVTKNATFVPGAYTTAVLVAQVKEGADVVAEGDFTFAGSTLVWTYDAALGWTAPVDLAALDTGPSVDVDFTMTATGTGTFTVSFWVQTP